MSEVTAALELNDASVEIGRNTIWSNFDLRVAQGEFVAVLGPNGAGKSSLLKVILGLAPLSSGSALVMGEKPGVANANIGYLPQRRSFDASLRVRGEDIVRLGLDGARWGLPLPRFARRDQWREEQKIISSAIELVGAGAYADRPIGQISGGEQQRLLIAQALVRRPKLLLLDEPLDSLDLPNQHAIASLIREIANREGITVVMVAHDVNPILTYLDRVVYIARGQAMAGTPAQVIRSETLSSLYETPIEVLTTSDGRLVVVGAPDGHTHHGHR